MHKSSSREQQMAEKEILERLFSDHNWCMDNFCINESILLGEKVSVCICPDFYSEKDGIIGEIHSHIGKLKPSQMHKICADILKMLLFEKVYHIKLRKMLVVCSEDEADQLSGNSYLGEAIRQFGIELICVHVQPDTYDKLVSAQERQKMVNA